MYVGNLIIKFDNKDRCLLIETEKLHKDTSKIHERIKNPQRMVSIMNMKYFFIKHEIYWL